MSIRHQRYLKGYTAKELGTIAGVAYRSIQNVECGASEVNSFNLTSLCKIAIALDCGLEDLIEGELRELYLLTLKNKKLAKS